MMDCRDVRNHLSRLMLPLEGETSAELLAAQEHLENCGRCQAEWERQSETDRALSQRMAEVEIPAELANRIRARITAEMPRPAAVNLHPRGHLRTWRWSAAAAALVLMLCLPLLMWTFSAPTVTFDALLATIDRDHDAGLSGWPVAPQVEFPAAWFAGPQLTFRGERIAGVQVYAAAFALRSSGGQPIPGVLWTVAKDSVSGASELPSLLSAQVHYGRGTEYLIWQESGSIYVAVLKGHGLHDFQHQLLARRTVT